MKTVRIGSKRSSGPARRVIAHAYYVVGTRGRCRVVLLVTRCPWCSRPHAHNGKPDAAIFRRLASCHGGSYELLVSSVEGAA